MSRVRIRFIWLTVFSILFSLLALVEARAAGITTRVSVDSSGNESNYDSYHPSLSADGRYVAFYSLSTNLVSGDTNGFEDVFVHER